MEPNLFNLKLNKRERESPLRGLADERIQLYCGGQFF